MNQKLIEKNRVDVKLEIAEIKKNLEDTDYVAVKIAEGVATKKQYADLIAQRKEWRSRINELEGEL